MILQSTSAPRVRPLDEIASHTVAGLPAPASILRFGPFEVSLERRELRKHGMRMKLEDKPFEILEALLTEPGRLVTRTELRAKLWPDTFVSYDHCLNTAVNKLRSALGDTSKFFRFVETVRRRGYRFIGALEAPQPPDPRAQRSVLLVLPFRTQPSNRATDSFTDGFTEELSAQIGRLYPAALGMIAVTTAMLYKGTACSIDEIARKVGADLVLEGSVRYAADRVRISVQLVQASDQVCLWSEIYERVLTDPFACQAEIAQLIASTLVLELGLRSSENRVQKFGAPIPLSSARIRKLGS
jgi:TolB-like protein